MTPTEMRQEKVDQILLREGSLQELKPFFPSREAILKCHAQRMAEIFPPDKKTNECECCQRCSAEFRVTFIWRGIYHTAETVFVMLIGIVTALGGHGIFPHHQVDFVTSHGLCGDCFKQIRRRRVLGKLVEKFCLVLIVISAIVFVPMLCFAPVLPFLKPTMHEVITMAVCLGGGLICLVAGLLGADRVVRWCIPKSLKFISKRPFQLIGLQQR